MTVVIAIAMMTMIAIDIMRKNSDVDSTLPHSLIVPQAMDSVSYTHLTLPTKRIV